ncbi:PQQ-binding-like beta-propeller repeat protein [Salinirubellus salinus]|uniref:PQQ-binding-like beta-propeller repeat protein n=1 Tax=Salinirubellus salinus TaxID=1364945 RepID=A0A9E7QZV1_9EURY|nr:PQQ-binding-like beta-propeller repeat protein [Salinirubellus salinus]UWM53090.1 PQQ-binding-like beta-propeller repeat protein [Salinirubellus salinus]
MDRRALLHALGAAGATGLAALAGCTDRSGSGSPTPTAPPSDAPTDPPGSPTGTPPGDAPSGAAVRWAVPLGGPARHPPTVADGTLYAAGGTNARGTPPRDDPVGPDESQSLFALDPGNGSERWRYESPAAMQSAPVVVDGAPHVVTGWSNGYTGVDTRVVRVDDGDRVWTTGSRSRFLSILGHADGTVFVGTHDDAIGVSGESLFAVGPDGDDRWSRDAGDALDGTVHDGTLYVDYGDQRLVAFDTADGAERWATDLGTPGRLAVYGDTLYLDRQTETEDGDYPLVAVDARTGEERWAYAADVDRFVATGAVEADGTVYVTEYDGSLFALDPADGTERWRYTAASAAREAPRVHDGTVYLPAGGELHAVDAATGEARWRESVAGHVWSALPSDAGVVVRGRTGGDRSTLRGLAPDGTERWAHTFATHPSRPAIDGLRAYVGTESGYVVALGA